MGRFEYTLLDVEDDQLVFGLWQKSSDKRQSKDIPALTAEETKEKWSPQITTS